MAELNKAQIHEIAERFLAAIPTVSYSPASGGFKGGMDIPDLEAAEAALASYFKKPKYPPYKPKPVSGLLALPPTTHDITSWEFVEPQFKLHPGLGAFAIYVHSKLKKNYQPMHKGMQQKDYGCGFILNIKDEDLDFFSNTLPKLKKQSSHAGTLTQYYSISKLVFMPKAEVAPGMYGTTQKVEVTLETSEEWQTYEMSFSPIL